MESLETTNPNYNSSTATPFDLIRASYLDEAAAPLSPELKLRREHIETAHSLLVNFHSLENAAKTVGERYGLSRATAYRRCQEAIRLFGDVTRSYKDGIRHLLYEYSMKVLALALGRKNEYKLPDPDLKAANAAIKNMAVLKGLDKDDSSAMTPELLGNKNYFLTVNVGGGSGPAKVIDLGNLERLDAGTYAEVVQAVEGADLSLEGMQKLLLEAKEKGEEDEDEDDSTAG